MTIEKLLEKIPPETRCELNPKKDCDVVTITFPKSKTRFVGKAFYVWLAISTYINANREAKRKGAWHG